MRLLTRFLCLHLNLSRGYVTDPLFTQPAIDVDEWRDKPVRHRYIHGGFKGTDTLFSMYLPPKELYQGRFFQHLMAVWATNMPRNAARAETATLALR